MSIDVLVERTGSRVRISPDSGNDMVVYNPDRDAVSSRLQNRFGMTRLDADYITGKVFSSGRRYKFNTSTRFVYGGRDEIESALQEQGGDIAAALGIKSFGVYYHLDGRLLRFGTFQGSAANARKIKDNALDVHPMAHLEIVMFDGKRAKIVG